MAEFEYKTIVAPTAPRKYKGVKSADERFARTVADAMNEAAAGGWQFVRTETLSVLVKKGALRGKDYEDRTVMVFSREKTMRSPAFAGDATDRAEPTL